MQAPSSVCPGYKQVEAFSNEDDYYESEEEEVSYITLDLGDIEPQLVPSASTYRLIGLDTPTPYLQLHGTIMKGRHDLLLGTELIFTDDRENHDWNNRSLLHVANTEQRIAFQEVTLIPKSKATKGKQKASPADDSPSTESPTKITTTTTPSDFQLTEKNVAEIDNLTGLTSHTPRKKKKEKPTTSGRKKATLKSLKGKGKAKEVLPSSDPDEDAIDGDNLEDMYMDLE